MSQADPDLAEPGLAGRGTQWPRVRSCRGFYGMLSPAKLCRGAHLRSEGVGLLPWHRLLLGEGLASFRTTKKRHKSDKFLPNPPEGRRRGEGRRP